MEDQHNNSVVTDEITQTDMRHIDRKLLFKDKVISILVSPWHFTKLICFSVGLSVILFFSAVTLVIYSFMSSLPDIEKLSFKDLRARTITRVKQKCNCKKIKYKWIPVKSISRDFIYSIVMSEDVHFFEHDGINYESIVRASIQNWRKKKIVSGASTLTQQVVKNVFLNSDRSLLRKLKEVIIAQRVEDRFTKNQILELYLNLAEFGPEIFGVWRGAKYYFNTTPQKVNAGEGAFLALMLPSPRKNHFKIYEKKNLSPSNLKKLRRIYQSLLYEEFITNKEYTFYVRKMNYFPKIKR